MYRWDGGFIMVNPDDFEKGVQWYQDVLGWKCVDQVITWVGRKAFMKLPRSGMVTIKSFEGKYEHFEPLEVEGNVKLVFVTYDIHKTQKYLEGIDVPYTEIGQLPNGQKYCEIIAFDKTKLTIVEELNEGDDNVYPDSGIIGFGKVNTIIHVKDPAQSAKWYETHLGFEVVEVSEDNSYAHLQTEDAYDRNVLGERFLDNIWLLRSAHSISIPNDNKARTYYDIRPETFMEEYKELINSGIKPSEIAGDPLNGWGGFHFYDPDHNRVDVWSYKSN